MAISMRPDMTVCALPEATEADRRVVLAVLTETYQTTQDVARAWACRSC